MILKDWLKREGINTNSFSNSLGVSAPSIYRSMQGAHTLSSKTCLMIEAVTNGDVPREHAMFPFDYAETNSNGDTQYRITPRIHTELAKGIVLDRSSKKQVYTDKEFFKWAYGTPKAQSPLAHCHKWAEKHPKLKRVDFMSIDEGFKYMKEEFEKYLKNEK